MTPDSIVMTELEEQQDIQPASICERFGWRIRDLRQQRNYTQSQLAGQLGIDRSFLSDVERGKKNISLTSVEVIARGLNLTISDLLTGL